MRKKLLCTIAGAMIICVTVSAQREGGRDPFAKSVSIHLDNETVVEGMMRVSQAAGIALSIEYPLGQTIREPAPSLRKFQTEVEPGSVSDVLNRLTALDPSFTWQRSGEMINVFPTSTMAEPNYFMNRRISSLTYQQVSDVENAIYSAVGSLPPPKEQIAMMETGESMSLPAPWTTTLHDISIREVLDLLMARIGPQYGWALSGSREFRLLRFHSQFARSNKPGS